MGAIEGAVLAYATNKKYSDILTGKMVMPKVKYDVNTGDTITFSDEEKNAFDLGTKAYNDLLLAMNQPNYPLEMLLLPL